MVASGVTNVGIAPLEHTGERMVPESSDNATFWQHVFRYAFACRFVKGKRVLDIACGEGYGAAALKEAGAVHVTGVDISEEVCRHAREKYGLDARPSSAEQIPLPRNSVDVVVSFETIEHVPNPLRFLDECTRVLAPGGRLIISTPNKGVYIRPGNPPNPFHCSEMTEDEFSSALCARFRRVKLYSQHPRFAPRWSLRAFAADQSPWQNSSLFNRLQRSARFRLAPFTVYTLTLHQRDAVQQILNPPRSNSWINPYALHRRRRGNGEEPAYFVANATNHA